MRSFILLSIVLHSTLSERKITGGHYVPHDKRYVVYLVSSDNSNHKYNGWMCGGALVSTRHILSASACLVDVGNLYVIAGYNKYVSSINLDSDNCTRTRKKRIVRVCTARDYSISYNNVSQWSNADIGIAFVETPYDFTDVTYRYYCSYIPDKIKVNYDAYLQREFTHALVFGWGSTEMYRNENDHYDYNSEYLRYAMTQLTNKKVCEKYYGHLPKSSYTHMICCYGQGNLDSDGNIYKHPMAIEDGGCDFRRKYFNDDPGCNDYFDWRRRHEVPDAVNKNPTQMSAESKRRNNHRRQGICQNDHGGPLVTWGSSTEYVIGVASLYLVSTDTRRCIPPFLYTSTYCNGLFLKCVLEPENVTNRVSCIKAFEDKTLIIDDQNIVWKTDSTNNNDVENKTVGSSNDKHDIVNENETSKKVPDKINPNLNQSSSNPNTSDSNLRVGRNSNEVKTEHQKLLININNQKGPVLSLNRTLNRTQKQKYPYYFYINDTNNPQDKLETNEPVRVSTSQRAVQKPQTEFTSKKSSQVSTPVLHTKNPFNIFSDSEENDAVEVI